jgi:hypothetical protein
MNDMNAYASETERKGFRNSSGPRPLVVVPSNRIDRCNRAQLLEDLRPANVPSVDDVLNAGKGANCFRAQQSMRVGDEADPLQRLNPLYPNELNTCPTIMFAMARMRSLLRTSQCRTCAIQLPAHCGIDGCRGVEYQH